MSDTISRSDAIEQIQTWAVNLINPKMLSREDAIYILESMPSAQPEIIRCKDCRKNPHCEMCAWLKEVEEQGCEFFDDGNKWIPCSERLPDAEEKRYWVCTDGGYQCQCRWTNINHFWTDLTTDWHWHIGDVPQYSKVIAWMSLPPVYQEEDNK